MTTTHLFDAVEFRLELHHLQMQFTRLFLHFVPLILQSRRGVFGEGSLEQPKGGEKCQAHAVELEFGRVRGDKQNKQSQRGS